MHFLVDANLKDFVILTTSYQYVICNRLAIRS